MQYIEMKRRGVKVRLNGVYMNWKDVLYKIKKNDRERGITAIIDNGDMSFTIVYANSSEDVVFDRGDRFKRFVLQHYSDRFYRRY